MESLNLIVVVYVYANWISSKSDAQQQLAT